MTRYLPAVYVIIAVAAIGVAVESWYRWEPAVIIVALVLGFTGMFTDPERPHDGDAG